MGEFVVIGALLCACFVLGLAMMGELAAEDQSFEPVPAKARQVMELRAEKAPLSLGRKIVEPDEEPLFAQPQILSRRIERSTPYCELSDDVLNRYRCYAHDLEQLRKDLAQAPTAEHRAVTGPSDDSHGENAARSVAVSIARPSSS